MKRSLKIILAIIAIGTIGIFTHYQILEKQKSSANKCDFRFPQIASKLTDEQRKCLFQKYPELPKNCFDRRAIPCHEYDIATGGS